MSVSILIPAFRPTFLRQAIASALTQGLDDFELIISDDSGGDDVRAVVEMFRDPRIRYVTTEGRLGAGENCRRLWDAARFDLIKYLFDDDILLPNAIGDLRELLRLHPQASFTFAPRNDIDERGTITHAAVIKLDGPRLVTGAMLAEILAGGISNPIGELSNILVNRACGLTADDLLVYNGLEMHVVADVAFFLNATHKGPAVAGARAVGSVRQHANQNSRASFNPAFAIGICEWEVFIRGEFAAGRLSVEKARPAVARLRTAYANWSSSHEQIRLMQPGSPPRSGEDPRDAQGGVEKHPDARGRLCPHCA